MIINLEAFKLPSKGQMSIAFTTVVQIVFMFGVRLLLIEDGLGESYLFLSFLAQNLLKSLT